MAKKKEITETDLIKKRQRKVLLGAGLLLISILLTISFISYFFTWQADFSTLGSLSDKAVTSKNLLNKLGAYVGHLFIYKGVGFSSILFRLSHWDYWLKTILTMVYTKTFSYVGMGTSPYVVAFYSNWLFL